jgi:hypothetical protein
VLRTDWVHDILQDGLMNVECALLFRACARQGITYEMWGSYLAANWEYPKHRRVKTRDLHYLFGKFYADKDESDKNKFKCSASELLSLFGLVRHFVESTLDFSGALVAECESFKAACSILDLILEAKRSSDKAALPRIATSLRAACGNHMTLHVRAYGEGRVKPKHHLTTHVWKQVLQDQLVLDMFIVERNNLRVKGVSEHIDNTRRFERSVLSSLLTQQHNQLQDMPSLTSGLRGNLSSLEGFESVYVADDMEIDGARYHKGDVVNFVGGGVALVAACARECSALYIIAQLFVVDGPQHAHSGRYRLTGGLRVLPARDVRETIGWYKTGDFWVVVR